MRLNVERRQPWDVEADVLAVTVPSDDALPEYVAEIDRRLDGARRDARCGRDGELHLLTYRVHRPSALELKRQGTLELVATAAG